MDLSTNLTLLIIGFAIGIGLAIIGGIAEYWLSLRSDSDDRSRELPSRLLFVLGGLALAGIVTVVGSFFLNGGIWPALILSAGMLGGFYIGFIFLFILWFLLGR